MDLNQQLPEPTVLQGRHPFIVERCKGKRVLHVGCVDAGLLEERFRNQSLLHQKLAPVTSGLLGVDIDADGISRMVELGFSDVVCMDVTERANIDRLRKREFDIIVLSEVLEHLPCPESMLNALREMMSPSSLLIVTVPNAFSVNVLCRLGAGVEVVHPDHNYYFSMYTLSNLLKKHQFRVEGSFLYVFLKRSDLLWVPRYLANAISRPLSRIGLSRPVEALKGLYWRFLDLKAQAAREGGFLRDIRRRAFNSVCLSSSRYFADGVVVVVAKASGD